MREREERAKVAPADARTRRGALGARRSCESVGATDASANLTPLARWIVNGDVNVTDAVGATVREQSDRRVTVPADTFTPHPCEITCGSVADAEAFTPAASACSTHIVTKSRSLHFAHPNASLAMLNFSNLKTELLFQRARCCKNSPYLKWKQCCYLSRVAERTSTCQR
jgi:hypothetical protein